MTDRLKTLALWILDDCVTMRGDDAHSFLSKSELNGEDKQHDTVVHFIHCTYKSVIR